MRLLAKVTIPLEKEGAAVTSEALSGTMRSAMERLKPEASYFFEEEGERTCLFVFNLDLQSLLKPLFQNVGATVRVTQVMNGAEFEQELRDPQPGKGLVNTDEGSRRDRAGGEPTRIMESELLADISPGRARANQPGDGRPREARVDPRRA